jgi:hypothetical protein
MTSKHIIHCPSCFKTLKLKECYEKHIFQCQRLHEENTPAPNQLYEMIKSLTEKYNSVQNELENLKRNNQIQNKKLNILEWLNKQNKPQIVWSKYIDEMKITLSNLELIFEKGLIDGVFDILIQYLHSNDSNDSNDSSESNDSNHVIKCFEQKKNIIYVFEEEWKIMNNKAFEDIFKIIYQKILTSFEEYRIVNESKMNDDNFQVDFNNNFMTILCVNIPFESKCVRIKNKLFNELKENFTSIIEFEL